MVVPLLLLFVITLAYGVLVFLRLCRSLLLWRKNFLFLF